MSKRMKRWLLVVAAALALPLLLFLFVLRLPHADQPLAFALWNEYTEQRQEEQHDIEVEQQAMQQRDAATQAYLNSMTQRFAGRLRFYGKNSASEQLQEFSLERGNVGGQAAVRVVKQGLVVSDIQSAPFASSTGVITDEDRALAQRRCRQLSPIGYWDLPSDTELYLLWTSQALGALPTPRGNSPLVTMNVPVQTVITMSQLAHVGAKRYVCVGITDGAPASGYLVSVIE